MGRQKQKKVKVALLDGQASAREAVKASIERHRRLTLLGTGADLTEAARSFGARKPDIWVVDPASTSEGLRDLRHAYPTSKLIVFASSESGAMVRDALRANAAGFLFKSTAAEGELVQAIDTVLAGGVYFSAETSRMLVPRPIRESSVEDLTPREREVLRMIAEGHTSRVIAQMLHVSVRTVDSHRKHISQKLGIRSIAGLTRYAISHGMIES